MENIEKQCRTMKKAQPIHKKHQQVTIPSRGGVIYPTMAFLENYQSMPGMKKYSGVLPQACINCSVTPLPSDRALIVEWNQKLLPRRLILVEMG